MFLLLFQSLFCPPRGTWQEKFGNHLMRNWKSYFLRHNSPSNPKYSWSMLCSSLKPGHFFHIVPIFSPMLETIWCVIKSKIYWLKYTCRYKFHFFGCLNFLPGTAGWRSSGMDSRSPGFWRSMLLLSHTFPGEGWTCSTWKHSQPKHNLTHFLT